MSTKTIDDSENKQASIEIPNWRVLKITEKHDNRNHRNQIHQSTTLFDSTVNNTALLLQHRAVWSESALKEALDLYDRLTSCSDSYVQGKIETSLNALDHAYRLYGVTSVICSFNGGKDAVVILHLIRAALANYCQQQQQKKNQLTMQPPYRPRVIYFEHEDEFPEILHFLNQTVEAFDLDMIAFEKGVQYPVGLKALVDHNQIPGSSTPFPLSFVLGTRSGDPNACNQGFFAPSSHYMPAFMRVNPILDWTYGHVWHFLRLFHLPYCSLYDRGYTSLGSTKDTLPCPALAIAGGATSAFIQNGVDPSLTAPVSIPKYWPAYMLRDWSQERGGRILKDKSLLKNASRSSPDSWAAALSNTNSFSTDRLSTMSDPHRNPSNNSSNTNLRDLDWVTSTALQSDTISTPVNDESVSCLSYNNDTMTQKTVGLLIIGDEILKGYTVDTNTQAAAQALRNHNVWLRRVVVVADDQDEIVNEIGRLQKEVDVIITSGGVGPTHDDVTINSVAVALECDLVQHEGMVQLLRDKMNGGDEDAELTDAQVKMATLPCIAKLRYLSDNPTDWPVLQCKNVFILPGVPQFFTAKIDHVSRYLACQLDRGAAYKVVLSVDENSIVPALNQVVENHPNVCIGSYPFVSHPDYKTVITVEGRLSRGGQLNNSLVVRRSMIDTTKQNMDSSVERALDELLITLPQGSILRVDDDDMLLYS